ncbi:MAG: glycerophosphodiester phosphodiesterase [Anaerolineae bacterium]|nr:glycerophosphodiester phosphodiesterase [Anaerolineae bacterium]
MRFKSFSAFFALTLALAILLPAHAQGSTRPLIIAHRGASGYLPEHTLEAKAMAYALGADYVEQDVVLTQDDVPIVVHDIILDTVTNIAEIFPGRARGDGHFYAIDFTLAEIKQLTVHERIDLQTGKTAFPNRFPLETVVGFEIPTLEEEIALIQGLNRSTGHDVGLYPELKEPAFHQAEGKDIGTIVLALLEEYGYTRRADRVFVQCFDPAYTRYLREELGTDLKLVQLISGSQANLASPQGLDAIAEYADGIGPSMSLVLSFDAQGQAQITSLVAEAHARGLVVHPYTGRADSLPKNAQSFDQLLEATFIVAGADGIFTDHTDRAIAFVNALQ